MSQLFELDVFDEIIVVILSIKMTTEFFYVYYIVKTLASMVTDGGIVCLSLSYLVSK